MQLQFANSVKFLLHKHAFVLEQKFTILILDHTKYLYAMVVRVLNTIMILIVKIASNVVLSVLHVIQLLLA